MWGTAGTNGQHAYFQLLHQGTDARADRLHRLRAPAARHDLGEQQDLLVANLLAQAEALAFGDRSESRPRRARRRCRTARCRATGRRACCSPTQLTPFALGALIAAYEHKVMTLGMLWGIDSFDQWGVELGKVLAGRIVAEIDADPEPALRHDGRRTR